ncbi:MAG: hypothetical protein EOO42_14370, partial [Flavobacteriales bacterium]
MNEKSSGVSEGYIAKRYGTDQSYMIKSALTKGYSVIGKGPNKWISNSSVNFINEYVTSAIYRRLLYNRAPMIEITESAEENKMKLRSKFLDNFQTISEFTKSNEHYNIGEAHDGINHVKGAEKLFASIIFGGEFDIHAGNLGVMTEIDEFGNEIKVFAKIDHGWSASKFFSKSSN